VTRMQDLSTCDDEVDWVVAWKEVSPVLQIRRR